MKYMLLAYTAAQSWDETSVRADEVARICREYAELEARLKDAGEWVASEGLADGAQTRTVSRAGSDVVVSDGPFLEAYESLVSFVMIDVADETRALEIARELVAISGETCELRPVMEMDLPGLDG